MFLGYQSILKVMCLFDLGFEREVPEEENEKILKSGIMVGEDCQGKRSKAKNEFDKTIQTNSTRIGNGKPSKGESYT